MHKAAATSVRSFEILNKQFDTRFLKKSDHLVFADDSWLTLFNYLGAGNNTQIFALQEDPSTVVRIPTLTHHKHWDMTMTQYNSYARAHTHAARYHYPLLKMWTRDGLIFTENVTPFLSLQEFLRKSNPDTEKLEALLKFVDHLRTLPGSLSDADTHQIGWHHNRWVFVDFGDFQETTARLQNGFSPRHNRLVHNIYLAAHRIPTLQNVLRGYFAEEDAQDALCARIWF